MIFENTAELNQVPYLDQYAGTWAIEENTFNLLVQKAQTLDMAQHLNSPHSVGLRTKQVDPMDGMISITSEGVGIVQLRGVMMKHSSSMSMGASTVLARQAIRSLVANEEVTSIVLHIESPGGTSAGTAQLGDEVRKATESKPVIAYIEDLGASAAYWVASQASEIVANAQARVGSIGTYLVVSDLSEMAAKEGVKVHVVRAGEFKGMGAPGAEITEKQLAELQRSVDGTNKFFLEAVASGRGMTSEQVLAVADGRAHFAADALEMGLIDGVESFDDMLARLSRGQNSNDRSLEMADETKTAASVNEIKTACPGISSDQVVAFAEAGKSLEECKDQYLKDLVQEVSELKESNDALQAKLDEAEENAKEAESLGVDPVDHVPTKESKDESATEQFQSLVKEKMTSGMTKAKATSSVVRQNPDLHAAFIAEVNR